MPTRNRRAFLERSLRLFRVQNVANKELIIIEDGDECNADLCQGFTYRYFGKGHMSIGEKRNRACQLAQGEIICHWDDDDYYGPDRLKIQAAPILNGQADMTALVMSLFFSNGLLWSCPHSVHKQLFTHNVRSGTLMYRAKFLAQHAYYANSSNGEDLQFLNTLFSLGAHLASITDPLSYVCVRHPSNTSDEIVSIHPLCVQIPNHTYPAIEQFLELDSR